MKKLTLLAALACFAATSSARAEITCYLARPTPGSDSDVYDDVLAHLEFADKEEGVLQKVHAFVKKDGSSVSLTQEELSQYPDRASLAGVPYVTFSAWDRVKAQLSFGYFGVAAPDGDYKPVAVASGTMSGPLPLDLWLPEPRLHASCFGPVAKK